jgi:hypothetical protein
VFVTDYIPGGDLMLHIQRAAFSPERARYNPPRLTYTQYTASTCLTIRVFVHLCPGGGGALLWPRGRSFYAAEVLLALECLHRNNIIYRYRRRHTPVPCPSFLFLSLSLSLSACPRA